MKGTTLLKDLPMIVLDLETTGLNVATDRIVQIGAVKMDGLNILFDEQYNQLINPAINISKKITKIHHISNEAVEGMPTYREKHKEFHDLLAGRVVVGHNIGFDLAIIRNETERLGYPIQDYRYLDIRLLGMLLNFQGSGIYLENLADYFGIKIENRHDALGDALLTAKIFERMIPLLIKKGVTMLSIAEKECYEQAQSYSLSYSSDWYYMRPPGMDAQPIREQSWNMLERIDPFPFSHTIQEIMKTELVTMSGGCELEEVIKKMAELSIASILIKDKADKTKGEEVKGEERVVGIITERDIIRLIVKNPDDFRRKKAREVMSAPLKMISKNSFLYQAIEVLEVNQIRHLPVHDDSHQVVGMISNRDLNRKRIKNFYRNQTNLKKSTTVEELYEVFSQIPDLIERLIKEEVSPRRITEVISTECNSLTKRATELALEKTVEETSKEAPCPYAVMILGSAGRGESMLSFDQDNALIFEAPESWSEEEREAAQEWFLTMGKHLNKILHKAGIPLCKGKVMAGEKDWCREKKNWEERVDYWFRSSTNESILHADIFLDLRFVTGDANLVYQLKKYAYAKGSHSPAFLKLMGEEIIDNTMSPLNLFGNFRHENGWFDMKKNILFPIVATARLLALKMGTFEQNNTMQRLEEAKEKLSLNSYEIEILQEIQTMVFTFMLSQQLMSLNLGEQATSKVFLSNISKNKLNQFKRLIPSLNWIEQMVRDAMVK